MTATGKWFGLALKDQFGATAGERVDWVSDTMQLAVIKATAPFNQDTNRYFADLNADEVSGTGYSAGGVVLASKTLTYDATTKTVRFKCANPSINPVTFTNGRWAVIYKNTGSPATSPMLGYLDFGLGVSPVAEPFNIYFDATDGALRLVLT